MKNLVALLMFCCWPCQHLLSSRAVKLYPLDTWLQRHKALSLFKSKNHIAPSETGATFNGDWGLGIRVKLAKPFMAMSWTSPTALRKGSALPAKRPHRSLVGAARRLCLRGGAD